MSASKDDYFQKVGRSTATTLSSPGYTIGDTSINVASTTNWPTDTGVTFAIDVVGSDGLRVSGSYNVFRGVVSSATQVSSVTYVGGDANRDYTSGATTRVYILVSAYRDNRFTDGLLVQHKNTGAHKDVTADSLVVSGTSTLGAVTATSLTLSGTASAEGWSPLGATPNTVTANGNNSFDLVFNSNDLTDTLTNGMRIRATRTVAAPNTAFSLDGTNDYYVKTSPNKLTFTDDWVISGWIYPTAYQTGAIASRYNGTSGFELYLNSTGQVTMLGHNAGSGNYRGVVSYQSIPLNKWTHIAVQMDMSAYTATTTTCYVMVDGADVPVAVTQAGTNPTAFIQAGNLEIGSSNGGTIPFAGYLDQIAVYSAKVTQATILASINRALTGSETSLASAYSNGSVNDLNTTTPNNLTATNGATTVASSPFGNRGVSTTLEYGVVMANTFSTNTTVTVQVPEGCQLPTTGGISSVDYSTQNVPYGFPRSRGRWVLSTLSLIRTAQSSPSSATAYATNIQLGVPTGAWVIGYMAELYVLRAAGSVDARLTLASSSASYSATSLLSGGIYANSVTDLGATITRQAPVSLTTLTTHYLNYYAGVAGFTTMSLLGDHTPVVINAENAHI